MRKGEKTEFEGRNNERKIKEVGVLCNMVATFAVFHLERSELNADAP